MGAGRPERGLRPQRALHRAVLRQPFQMRRGVGPLSHSIGGKTGIPVQLRAGGDVGDAARQLKGLRVQSFRQVRSGDAMGKNGNVRCRRGGLAFQIVDDVLDITQSSEQLGKTAGKDTASEKATYPALFGVDQSLEKADTLVHHGCDSLDIFGAAAETLKTLARFLVERKK